MPSLLESVTALLGEGDTLSKLGELMGGDEEQASATTKLAVPAVLGGVADTAAQESGMDVVMGMLDNNRSVLGDLGGFLDRGQAEAGNGVLDAVFGDTRADTISALASKAGVANSTIGKLLPMLAPIVVGVINKVRVDDKLDQAGLGSLLATERAELEAQGLFETPSAKLAGAAAAVGATGAMMASGGSDKLDDVGDLAGSAAGSMGENAGDAAGAIGDAAAGVAGNAGDAAGAVAGAATGAIGGAVAGLKGGASGAADAAKGAAGAAKDTAIDTAKDAAKDTADTAKEAAGAGKDATVGKAKEAAAGIKGTAGRGDDDGTGSLGWLWWALGAVVLVLLLAWLLSTCNDETTDASNDATVAVESDDDGDGDSSGDADDGDGADADLQAAVDGALDGSGVTGAVSGGEVTLTGTVDDDAASQAAEDAVAALDGVDSVDNRIEVGDGDAASASDSGSDADADDTDADTDDTDADDADAETDVDASAGDTINELLDLDPVTFRVSSARITDEGIAVLDNAVAFLEANPDVEIEIGGHTDSDGAEAENQDLSQRRADSVKEYLESQGIDGDRMETMGYGESEPKVPNTSAAAKAENRRIEFTIL